MIVGIQTRRLRVMGQLQAFLEANKAVDFQSKDRDDASCFARDTLYRFGYRPLGNRHKAWCSASWLSLKQMSGWCGGGGRPALT